MLVTEGNMKSSMFFGLFSIVLLSAYGQIQISPDLQANSALFSGSNIQEKVNLKFDGEWQIWIPALHPDSRQLTYKYIDSWTITKGSIVDSKKNVQPFELEMTYLRINEKWFFLNEIRDKCLIIFNIAQNDTSKIPIMVPKTARSPFDTYSGCFILIRNGTDIDDIFYRGVSE